MLQKAWGHCISSIIFGRKSSKFANANETFFTKAKAVSAGGFERNTQSSPWRHRQKAG